MARSERFELPTLGIEIRCSIQLSYERISLFDVQTRGSGDGHGVPARRGLFAFGGELFNPPPAGGAAEQRLKA